MSHHSVHPGTTPSQMSKSSDLHGKSLQKFTTSVRHHEASVEKSLRQQSKLKKGITEVLKHEKTDQDSHETNEG